MYSRSYIILISFLFAGATLAAHGWSLDDGLFLDDHWHLIRYLDKDWSFHALMDAGTIEPERFVESWWQEKPVRWTYARPFAIFVTKLACYLSGGRPAALHAVSLGLHWIGTLLVHHLCLRLTRRRFWSVVGGLLFVVYSHSLFAVGWIAAQNTVLQTILMLGALLGYVRASGLNLYPYGHVSDKVPAEVPPLRYGVFFVVVILWVFSLLSRENALVLLVFLPCMDLAFGGWRQVRARWGAYLALTTVATAFVFWRLLVSESMVPDFYLRRPDGPGYVFWLIAKGLHYLTAAVWLSPLTVGPSGRFHPFIEVPGDCLLMVLILSVLGVGYYVACRKARGWWLWPLWIVLSVLPVLPVLATPHSGYMPAMGFAVAMILGPALHDRLKPGARRCWSKYVASWFLIATTTYMPIYRVLWNAMQAAEQLTISKIMEDPPPAEATDVFFINLPFVNIYAQLHLAEEYARAGMPRPDFRAHVLTYASSYVIAMQQRCRLEQLDDRSFALSVEGRPYFSGALGRFLVEGMRTNGRFHTEQVVHGKLFDVEIAEAHEQGVSRLIFRFHRPLADRQFCFYITTQHCPAARVQFNEAGVVGQELSSVVGPDGWSRNEPCPETREQKGLRQAVETLFHVRQITRGIIRTDLYQTGPPYPGPR